LGGVNHQKAPDVQNNNCQEGSNHNMLTFV